MMMLTAIHFVVSVLTVGLQNICALDDDLDSVSCADSV